MQRSVPVVLVTWRLQLFCADVALALLGSRGFVEKAKCDMSLRAARRKADRLTVRGFMRYALQYITKDTSVFQQSCTHGGHMHTKHMCEREKKASEWKGSRNLQHLLDWISNEIHETERCPYTCISNSVFVLWEPSSHSALSCLQGKRWNEFMFHLIQLN